MALQARIRKILWPVIVCTALACIPFIYAGLLAYSNIDPTHNLSSISAAIVDEDEPAEAADGSTQHLGDDLADELLDNDEDTNFDWSEMSADAAESALESGEALAVLTIPSDFSEAAVSAGSDDVADAMQAKLTITTNDGANLIVGNIAGTVGETIVDTLRSEVSETYLENVYLGFTDVHSSVADAADGASELATGASDASDGSGELVVGLRQLADGTVDLSDGAASLAAGAATATDGATTLSGGLAELSAGAATVPDQAATLADGAASVAEGAEDARAGAADLADGAGQLADKLDELAGGARTVSDGAGTALTGARSLQQGAAGALAGATELDTGLDRLLAGYDVMTDDQRKAALAELAAGSDLLVGDAASGSGLSALSAGATQLVGDKGSGLTLLAAGAGQVADGAETAADKTGDLSDGADLLATGASRLDDGAAQVSDGASALSSGLATLVDGIDSAAAGASQLADGMPALSSGAAQLAGGAATLQSGTVEATGGAETLDDGLDQLSDGAGDLSSGLADGVDEIPSYTDDEASQLASVAADQVVLDQQRVNEVPEYGYGLAPYFMALSLWVGALAFYMMMPALRDELVAGRRSAFGAALRSLGPGALMALVQSALMVIIVHFGVGIEFADLPGAFGIALLTSVTFFAINQALIALLGAPGRFIALVFMVFQLASAGGSYPIQTAPEAFQRLNVWLPLTYPVEAFRSLIAGGSIGISTTLWVLPCWLLGAFALTLLAIVLKRRAAARGAGDGEGEEGEEAAEAESGEPVGALPA